MKKRTRNLTMLLMATCFFVFGNYAHTAASPVTIKGVPHYLDEKSAIADGLVPGAIYRTGEVLKIVRQNFCEEPLAPIGNYLPGDTSNAHLSNHLLGQSVTAPEATLCGFGIIVESPSSQQIQFALYDDDGGSPGNLVAQSHVYIGLTNGINFIPVLESVELSPGIYWLMKVVSSELTIKEDTGISQPYHFTQHIFGLPLPDPYVVFLSFSGDLINAYLWVK